MRSLLAGHRSAAVAVCSTKRDVWKDATRWRLLRRCCLPSTY